MPLTAELPPPADGQHPERGFTLVEMVVTLLVLVEVLLGALLLFDFNSKLTRVQTGVTGMQQSLRAAQHDMVRMVRMAGRGDLPLPPPPPPPGAPAPAADVFPGLAVGMRDNVAAGALVAPADPASPRALEGTDVLTLRGVFTGSIYMVNFADSTSFATRIENGAVVGQVRIDAVTNSNVAQDLQPLLDAIADGRAEALILVSPVSEAVYAVVELDPAASSGTAGGSVTLAFKTQGDARSDGYARLSAGGGFPAALRNQQVARVGILEEYRYYVREERAVPTDPTSDLSPRLARLRVFPGTDLPYTGSFDSSSVDVADEVLDLQVALGFDSPNLGAMDDDADGVGPDDQVAEATDGVGDDWLFNSSKDDASTVHPLPLGGGWTWTDPLLYYVRITTLTRTGSPDRDYLGPVLDRLEDRTYGPTSPLNARRERQHRRRFLETVVDLRSFG